MSYTDDIGFSGIPPTIMVECLHEKFNSEEKRKKGSVQKYMVSKGDREGYGNNKFSELSEHELHKISVLDIRLANADRHLGNPLLSTEEDQLIPIDHGCYILENFERCRFDWIGWSQCKKAYAEKILNYIRKINSDEDIKYLQAHGLILSDESQQTLRISSMILKQGAHAGKTPLQIGNMFHKDDPDDKEYESIVQKLVREAREATSAPVFKHLSSLVDQHFGLGEGICDCGHQKEINEVRNTLQKEIDLRIQAEDTSNMLRNQLKDQSKAKDLKIADLNMELKHEREIKRQAEV
uniref:phosphatidylinositol 4-kinase gamma 4-like n=1 Tax=Fragaria vesca subsp. vesca TaxID=101020 RepID=UPI0005C85B62|nr:PREDICTED: phosphatidylinositol 4-kinase gamma 4-like [Fragaria vesca subsp. vesca]